MPSSALKKKKLCMEVEDAAAGSERADDRRPVCPVGTDAPDAPAVVSVAHHLRFKRAVFFFTDTATTGIYTLSLHDALPIYDGALPHRAGPADHDPGHRHAGCRRGPV